MDPYTETASMSDVSAFFLAEEQYEDAEDFYDFEDAEP